MESVKKGLTETKPSALKFCYAVIKEKGMEVLIYQELNAKKGVYAKANGYDYLDTIAVGLTMTNEPLEKPDTAHYDCDSIIKLGEMFAEKIVLR